MLVVLLVLKIRNMTCSGIELNAICIRNARRRRAKKSLVQLHIFSPVTYIFWNTRPVTYIGLHRSPDEILNYDFAVQASLHSL